MARVLLFTALPRSVAVLLGCWGGRVGWFVAVVLVFTALLRSVVVLLGCWSEWVGWFVAIVLVFAALLLPSWLAVLLGCWGGGGEVVAIV